MMVAVVVVVVVVCACMRCAGARTFTDTHPCGRAHTQVERLSRELGRVEEAARNAAAAAAEHDDRHDAGVDVEAQVGGSAVRRARLPAAR